jgi:putative hemolysin
MNSTANDFHTRYPVCEEDNKNEVLGYVNFKELVAIHRSHPGTVKVNDILRPVPFSEPDDSAAELLEHLTMQNCHITIVRDPATNTTLGLVTLEDIIEELLGDLDDEFDPLPRTFYSPQENFWIVGGGIPLTQLARDTGLDLPRRVEPASAWFARELKRHPKVGDVLAWNNAEFYVRKVRRSQVWEFNLKRSADE